MLELPLVICIFLIICGTSFVRCHCGHMDLSFYESYYICVCNVNIINDGHALILYRASKFRICWLHGYQFKDICSINECDTRCMVDRK